jgi:hypothetical protein
MAIERLGNAITPTKIVASQLEVFFITSSRQGCPFCWFKPKNKVIADTVDMALLSPNVNLGIKKPNCTKNIFFGSSAIFSG